MPISLCSARATSGLYAKGSVAFTPGCEGRRRKCPMPRPSRSLLGVYPFSRSQESKVICAKWVISHEGLGA
jgi:hypothetical protein